MGEWIQAGDGARLMMLVMHDDAQREYAYGPAQGAARHQSRYFQPGAVQRGIKAKGLERHQHEEGLEANFCIREIVSGANTLTGL